MGDILKYLGNSFGEFMDGFFGGILDWGIDFLDKVGSRLVELVKAILSIFDNLPKILSGFNDIFHSCFWFLPDVVWNVLYAGMAIVFLYVIFKVLFRK